MNASRRDFIKGSLALGGALLLPLHSTIASKLKDPQWLPAYGNLENKGQLNQRVEEAYAIFEDCRLCPRQCGVNRLNGERGFCRAPAKLVVNTVQPHYGEEISLVGSHGSGTVFFSNCNFLHHILYS